MPSTFKYGQRAHQQRYQDAMAIVAEHGKPDYFITFVGDPNWPEIRNSLYPYQNDSKYRPDVVNRVFLMKLQKCY